MADLQETILLIARKTGQVAIVLSLVLVAVYIIHSLLKRQFGKSPENTPGGLTIMSVAVLAGVIVFVLGLPLPVEERSQLLSLISFIVTAVIGLSSTTFVGNAMAGMMMRVVKSYKVGDFLEAGEHFGRVTERGIFHTEIQTEDRDLKILPNMFLVTNPIKVMQRCGTIVSAEVSLGYDVSRQLVEETLIESAEAAGLKDSFVYILQLQDFSIVYRVSGLLGEVKTVISARSNLRKKMVDGLHAADIEIVSPSFMNQRQVSTVFIPETDHPLTSLSTDAASLPQGAANLPEKLFFDKADQAETIEVLRERLKEAETTMQEIQKMHDGETDEKRRDAMMTRLEGLEKRRAILEKIIERREEQRKSSG